MNIKNIKYFPLAAALAMGFSSCEDFLDRPSEDNYNVAVFYKTDEQCWQGVNYLYNSPWYDFQRGYFKMGEVMSGNMYMGGSPYLDMTVNGTDTDNINMSYSLWAVIGHANNVYTNLNTYAGPDVSESVKSACLGECLTLKALAYFFLARTYGEVPIIHDNSKELEAGTYNTKFKVERADVYEYIIMTLEEAMKLLPKAAKQAGRIDYYCAEGLLSKVYLTKAGLSGSLSQADLDKAAGYAKDVIDNSGRHLMPVYSDIFRLQNNTCEESLIAWRWSSDRDPWTQQNTLQSDLAMVGFDEFGDCWGGWNGPSVDLQDAFGVSALDDPSLRSDVDTRRKATMMLAGDVYEYFWTDKGGFDYLRFIYDSEYGKGGPGQWQCPTGSNNVKNLYGNTYDHVQATGKSPDMMANGLATHLLRLADVYLIYAEAKCGTSGATADASAVAAYNAVHSRAIPTATPKTAITFDDVWKERRLELAGEGDRWYDYVRLSYYNPQRAISELTSQRRGCFNGYDELAKAYYESGKTVWNVDPEKTGYDKSAKVPNVTVETFTIPFPTEDVVFNPNLMKPAIHVDVREEYSY